MCALCQYYFTLLFLGLTAKMSGSEAVPTICLFGVNGRNLSDLNVNCVFIIFPHPTLKLTGMQKQSEAPLLHAGAERIVRLLATEEW